MNTAVAIRHVHFEDLGTFEAVLVDAGYKIHYCDLRISDLRTAGPESVDLLIVLGGPIGVYETDTYPFLVEEQHLLQARVAQHRPTLGICLGAQLIASVLGAKVGPTGSKEIGFSELALTDAGRTGPLRHLHGAPVLHWHWRRFCNS
ncbi:glutamine amidotransferase-related protein [Hyphomicrobium sp.]|uniref:glutamine amidotransferase-related protein n=1 Tax=Hyphomicrobium sp. TaxID=82 RepID=UPI002FE3636A